MSSPKASPQKAEPTPSNVTPDTVTARGAVAAGTLHLAVPFDDGWVLEIGGTEVAPRRAFGTTMAFDVAAAGTAALEYRTSMLRTLWVLLVGLAWLVLVAATTRLRWRHLVGWRAPLPELDDTTSIADWRTPTHERFSADMRIKTHVYSLTPTYADVVRAASGATAGARGGRTTRKIAPAVNIIAPATAKISSCGTPRSMSAPMNMSPAMPDAGSTIATRVMATSGTRRRNRY